MRKEIITACLLICSAITALGQDKSIDERISMAMNNSGWSELRELYASEGKNLQTPYLHTLSKFFISQFYNQPDSAIAHGNVIMDKYQSELSASLPAIAFFMAEDYSRLGSNDMAYKIMHNLNEAYRKSGVEPYQTYAGFEDAYRIFSEQPAFSVVKPQYDTHADLSYFQYNNSKNNSQKMLYISTRFNGKDLKAVFDTGAGINMMTREVAESVGARTIKTKGLVFNGLGIGTSGEIAFVDSITLGDVTFRNVPFFIDDFKIENDKANKKIKEIDFNCVIGNQMMMALGEIYFDFNKMQLVITSKMSEKPDFAPNFFYSANHQFVMKIKDNLSDKRIDAILDSGSPATLLTYRYYRNNESLFAGKTAKDSISMGGLGGAHTDIRIIPTEWSYEIAGNKFRHDSICVLTEQIHDMGSYDCLFGLQTMASHNKMRINFKDMWIRFEE